MGEDGDGRGVEKVTGARKRHIVRTRELEKRLSDIVLELRREACSGTRRCVLHRKLFDDLYGVLRRFLEGKRLPAADLEDTLQNAIIKILDNLHRWEGRGPFLAYCYRITGNQVNLWWRRRKQDELFGSTIEADDEEGGPLELPSTAPGPEDDFIDQEISRHLRNAVRQLPPQRRLCLELRLFQDLSYREIAAVLGITVGAVGANINFAKRQLKKVMGPIDLNGRVESREDESGGPRTADPEAPAGD